MGEVGHQCRFAILGRQAKHGKHAARHADMGRIDPANAVIANTRNVTIHTTGLSLLPSRKHGIRGMLDPLNSTICQLLNGTSQGSNLWARDQVREQELKVQKMTRVTKPVSKHWLNFTRKCLSILRAALKHIQQRGYQRRLHGSFGLCSRKTRQRHPVLGSHDDDGVRICHPPQIRQNHVSEVFARATCK